MTDQPDEKAKGRASSSGTDYPGSGAGLRQRAEWKTRADLEGIEDLSFLSPEARDHLLHELRVHQIELEKQNEELRRAYEELEATRSRYFDLYNLAPVGYFILNGKGLIREANLTASILLETTPDRLINQPFNRFILTEDQDLYYQHCQDLFKDRPTGPGAVHKPRVLELRLKGRDGQPSWARLDSQIIPDKAHETFGIHLAITDISRPKRLEEALAQKSQEWSTIFDAFSDAVILLDNQQTIQRCNRAFADFIGLSFQEIVGRKCHQVVHGSDQLHQNCPFRQPEPVGGRRDSELEVGDRTFSVTVDPILDNKGQPTGAVHILSDITARKRADEALRKSEEHLRLISRELAIRNSIRRLLLTITDEAIYPMALDLIRDALESPDGVFGYLDDTGRLVCPTLTASIRDQCRVPDKPFVFPPDTWGQGSWSRALREKRTICQNTASDSLPPGHIPITRHISLPLIHRGQVVGLILVANKEKEYTRGDSDLLETIGDVIGPVLSARLKTEKKEKERQMAVEALGRAEEKYRSIVENAVEGFFQTTVAGKFLMANPAVARFHGYDSPEELLASVADVRNELYFDPKDRDEYQRLLEIQGVVKGFEARFFRKDRTIWWGSMNVRSVRDKAGKILYYEGTIEDISERKAAEKARDENLQRIRISLQGTISTLALTSEIRDPYTAGHQRQVADLARAIALEMGLSGEVVDGLRMAGVIHDLGKIAIPVEILSTPRPLTTIEYEMIKIHPQVAYDILKEIEFPWPIAQIVFQHHERLDGSGYPRGLKGDEILPEARILAVADVVEAIASHRPYRPARGIDKALEEIAQKKGLLYDSEVVAACLRLFRKKGYSFREGVAASG